MVALRVARRLYLLLVSLLLIVFATTACDMFDETEASCATPVLYAEPQRAAPGEEFLLHGEGLARGGCKTIAEPNRNIRIVFRQGSATWELATVDVGRDASLEVTLRVPTDTNPGEAAVRATGSDKTAKSQFTVK